MSQFGQFVESSVTEVERHSTDMHLVWSSPSAIAQREVFDRWAAGVSEMRENLDELCEVARTAHTNYCGAVDTNIRMWP